MQKYRQAATTGNKTSRYLSPKQSQKLSSISRPPVVCRAGLVHNESCDLTHYSLHTRMDAIPVGFPGQRMYPGCGARYSAGGLCRPGPPRFIGCCPRGAHAQIARAPQESPLLAQALPFLERVVELPTGLGQLLPGLPGLPRLPRIPRELSDERGSAGDGKAAALSRQKRKAAAAAGRVRSRPPEAPRPGVGEGRHVFLQVRFARAWVGDSGTVVVATASCRNIRCTRKHM